MALRRASASVAEAVRSEEFLSSLYLTLRAWGLGTRGSSLASERRFAAALQSALAALEDLEDLAIDKPDLPDDIPLRIWTLIESLDITDNKARIVAGAKALHHLLPELVVPMDRQWTGQFFQLHAPEWQGLAANQRSVFLRMYRAFAHLARAVDPTQYATGEGWRTSRSKVLDNAVIGYCKLELSGPGRAWPREPR
jgi:hypothetical protein